MRVEFVSSALFKIEELKARIAELEAERDAAMAEAVEVERWHNTDVVRTMGPHFCDFFFGGPGAADFLQQQLAAACREAAARELEGLMESEWKWEEFELKASIYARLADLRNEQPTACSEAAQAAAVAWVDEQEGCDA